MNRAKLVEVIEHEKLVFVTRLKNNTQIQSVITSLIHAGAKVMEITSNTPNYAEEISKSRELHKDVLIGAGTVTNKKIALEAIKAGAQFLVTPNTNLELIDIAHQNEIPILMGALTPTEVCAAWDAGADFVKLFPADIFGITYFESITAPLSKTRLMAVGGIGLKDVKSWMEAGACGIGIASVIKEPVKSQQDLENIKQNASNFISELEEYK